VAQHNPDQRQAVVNIICAYLRMPCTPPARLNGPEEPAGPPGATPSGRDCEQELQVRLTAQRILTGHLRRPGGIEREQAGRGHGASGATATPGVQGCLEGRIHPKPAPRGGSKP
jgi:hypothetical protein